MTSVCSSFTAVLILLALTLVRSCSGTEKRRGHLRCVLSLSQDANTCGSSQFMEFFDVADGVDQNRVSQTNSAVQVPPSSSTDFVTTESSNFKIYVFDYGNEDTRLGNSMHFWNTNNFTWSLACQEDFNRIHSYYEQAEGISINSMTMSGSARNFFKSFNMTSGGSVADLCERLKAIKCKFIIQPILSEQNVTHRGGFAQSAFGFILNGFVYMGAARLFCR